jgi:hypothetical protein
MDREAELPAPTAVGSGDLLGHESVTTKIDSINQNARPISRYRTCPPHEPARAKPKLTVECLLISTRTAQIIASHTDSIKPKNVSWPNVES